MVFLDTLKTLPPPIAILAVSFAVSLVVTVIYKFATNQKLMKALQAEMKALRSEIKNAKDTGQATALNKRLMEKTMQQVMHSMKATFITMVPIFLLVTWMHGNFAYHQAQPGEEFTASLQFEREVQGNATLTSETLSILSDRTQAVDSDTTEWKLAGEEGTHELTFGFGDEVYKRKVIVTNEWKYADPYLEKENKLFGIINLGDKNPIKEGSAIRRAAVELQPVHPFGNLKLFGWQPGWLATYIIFTMAFTFPMRKLLKVH